MNADAERRYRNWVEPRTARLHRTAYLLGVDWHGAQDLAQETLVRAAVQWSPSR